MPVLDAEFETIGAIVAAGQSVGSIPPSCARVPLSTGVFGHADEVGVRLDQVLGFTRRTRGPSLCAPVDGLSTTST